MRCKLKNNKSLRNKLYFERFFVKDPSNSLKSRAEAMHLSYFATLLQNYEKVFEGLRETFFKKFP